MRICTPAALVVFTLACGGGGSSPTGPATPPPSSGLDFTPVTETIQTAIDGDDRVQGAAILLLRDGRLLWERGFGGQTIDSEVEVASGAKLMTAFTIMTLVDAGVVKLNVGMGSYLRNFTIAGKGVDPVVWNRISLRQLLSLTSGIRTTHPCIYSASATLTTCAQEVTAFALVRPPGEGFVYGQTPFTVAGTVAEHASGMAWSEIFSRNVAEPLRWRATRYLGGDNPQLGDGARSTVREYARMLEVLAGDGTWENRRVLSEASIREMLADQTDGARIVFTPRPGLRYGLGVWRDRVGPDGEALAVSAPGSRGLVPWVDFERDLIGVLYVPPHLSITGDLASRVLDQVTAIVPPTR